MRSATRFLSGLALAACTASGCGTPTPPDAYGNVEATEVVVSAEATGQLLSFNVQEGQPLDANATVGAIDATPLALLRDQLTAERAATASRATEVTKQVQVMTAQRDAAKAQQDVATTQKAALETQLDIARRAFERTQRLFAQQAATSQQLDEADRDYRVLQDQVKAQYQQIVAHGRQVEAQEQLIAATQAQHRTATDQTASVDAQIAQVSERIRKSAITNPSAGTVLVTYAKTGEVVQSGQPLYTIANLAAVDVRAYITEPQLAAVRVGQPAQVTVDVSPRQRQTLTGTITWISARAEFTPTPIQTRDERAALVYAVKIRVPNPNALLKIGMPVDVTFAHAGAAP